MIIKTSDTNSIKPFLKRLNIPKANSHKGQNGRVLIIGGSSLFHSASIWAAEIASRLVDIVHYSSTQENNEIFLLLKKKFHNGIVVPQKDLFRYVAEDDAILVGPGMMREGNEGQFTRNLTEKLIKKFPEKRFVFDAGSLQMMDPNWLLDLKVPAILTPHKIEFENLFNGDRIEKVAEKYHCVVLLKAIDDHISDGREEIIVKGGNQGLTKGGTGDLLAGLCVSFYAKNDPVTSAVIASYILKKTADKLSQTSGYWYNIDDLIHEIPHVLNEVV